MELNLLSLRSNFAPTAMRFAANSSDGCSLRYNSNPVSVHSQIELRTRHRMPNQKILVLERGKKILDMCYTTFDTDLIFSCTKGPYLQFLPTKITVNSLWKNP